MNLTPTQRAVLEFCPPSDVNGGANAYYVAHSTELELVEAAEALRWLRRHGHIECVGGGLYRRTAKGDEEVGK